MPPNTPDLRTAVSGRGEGISLPLSSMATHGTGVMSIRSCVGLGTNGI